MEKDFLRTVVSATGLPEHLIEKELLNLIAKHGMDPQRMSIEDLRQIMVNYLQTELLKAKNLLKSYPQK